MLYVDKKTNLTYGGELLQNKFGQIEEQGLANVKPTKTCTLHQNRIAEKKKVRLKFF